MIDRGHGVPLVLIPGLQGRWEWMRPAVDALARHGRVISFSLCDERTSPFPCDPRQGFENYITQITLALDRAGVDRAVIAGVSYGGLIATEFAARHPDRVAGLVLVSALHSTWEPNELQRRYLNAPHLMSPVFVATAPTRMRPEVTAALPSFLSRLRFAATHGARVVTAPTTPARMARRIAWAKAHRFADPASIAAPALIVTGEPALDKIVPVEVTERYKKDLQSAQHVVLEHTGHIGLVTRPDAFAGVVERFVDAVRLSA